MGYIQSNHTPRIALLILVIISLVFVMVSSTTLASREPIASTAEIQTSGDTVVQPINILNNPNLGAITLLAQNGGSAILRVGDIVTVIGARETKDPNQPVTMLVRKANYTKDDKPIGVVYRSVIYESLLLTNSQGEQITQKQPVLSEEPAPADGYVLIIVRGTAQVHAKVTNDTPIQAGDTLTLSGEAGYAVRLPNNSPRIPIGIALNDLKKGKGLIAAYVNFP